VLRKLHITIFTIFVSPDPAKNEEYNISYNHSIDLNMRKLFVHHVFFWLKKPVTHEIRVRFENALRTLVTVETIVDHHLGIPAATNREVIDSSYSYSLLLTFRNQVDQDIYQTHATHLNFIKECKEMWERVAVYDSISI
jgi:hypothetical protein